MIESDNDFDDEEDNESGERWIDEEDEIETHLVRDDVGEVLKRTRILVKFFKRLSEVTAFKDMYEMLWVTNLLFCWTLKHGGISCCQC